MRYFINENLELVTLDEMKKTYDELIETGEITGDEPFDYYLEACQAHNNGSLTEITQDDLKWIEVTTVYYTPGRYAEIQHHGKTYGDYLYRLKSSFVNGNAIKWNGVNGVIVNEDDNRIFQASGYTYDRGLFCDLY